MPGPESASPYAVPSPTTIPSSLTHFARHDRRRRKGSFDCATGRYYSKRNGDGSRTVVSTGPFFAVARALAPLWLIVLTICFFWQLIVFHFATAGVFLLVIGIFMPNFAKRRRLGNRGGDSP